VTQNASGWHAIVIEKGVGKRCLRDLLYRYVPQELVDRPKQGFSIPVDSWLRSALKDWAAGLISQEAIQRVGLLDWQRLNTLWNQHKLKSDDHGHRIWAVLMLQELGLVKLMVDNLPLLKKSSSTAQFE